MATVVLRVDSACRRTICRSASLLMDCCSLGRCTNTCRSRVLTRGDPQNTFTSEIKFEACIFVRVKSGQDTFFKDSDEDSDVEEEFEVDADSPPNYKLLKIYVKSLRADALLSSGLNVARNKIDELFYNSKLQVNGKQLLKKGQKLKDGDYVDVVTDARRDLLKVKRVKVMKVLKERTKTDKMSVIICAWRDGFEVENKEQELVS